MAQYQYEVREGKIWFTSLPEGKDFIAKLTAAFGPADFRITNYDDLWMQDEIALTASIRNGHFVIYRDAAGYYMINPVTAGIDATLVGLLQNSLHFSSK